MPSLKVKIELAHQEVLPGEEFWVEASVENTDVEPVSLPEMPSPSPSPFRFVLHNDKTGKIAYEVSQEDFRIGIAGDDTLVFNPPPLVEIEPVGVITVTEDIAGYALEPFAPGRYRVTGIYRLNGQEFRSEPVAVEVKRPQIELMARIYCQALRVFVTVVENLSFEGNVTLYQRETLTANPENGVFRRRIEREGTRRFDDLSIAAYTYWEGEGRWFAWLRAKKISGAKCWGHALTAECDAQEIALEQGTFVNPAFQLEDETALFPIVGSSGDAAQVQFASLGYEQCIVMDAAPLCGAVPSRVFGRYDGSNESAPITLIWDEAAANISRIFARRYTLQGRSADDSPQMIYERPSTLLAYEADAFIESAEGDEGLIHALFGPEEPEDPEIKRQQVVYVVIDPANPSRPMFIRRLTIPDTPADMWSIAAPRNGGHVVVLRTMGKLLWATAESNSWQLLCEGVEDIERLRLFAADDRIWAQWLVPQIGVRSMLVPAQ